MQVIKNINNNVTVCIDSKGKELVAFGKGIGFKKPPYEIELSQIEKTFYDIDKILYESINDIEIIYFDISAKVVDYATTMLDTTLNSNIVFTLADHIKFAITKYEEQLNISLPIMKDIEHLYDKEYEIGDYAVKLINKQLNVNLPKEEIAGIAIHLINAEKLKGRKGTAKNQEVVKMMTDVIEDYMNIKVDMNSFSYSRFVTHVEYLLKRVENQTEISSENAKMYQSLVEAYPEVYQCVEKIKRRFNKEFGIRLCKEELLYLMLHVNRVIYREDCDR